MFTEVGLIAFCFISGAAMIGLYIGNKLPESSRSDATQRTVQNVINVLGVLSALVLGMLIAGTKTSYDVRSREVEEFATNLLLLDRELRDLGPPAEGERDSLRAYTARKLALIWPKERDATPIIYDPQTVAMFDAIEGRLRAWTPQTDADRFARASALSVANEVQRTSRLLAVQETSKTPPPYVYAVILWVGMLFLGHAVFAPRNAIAIVAFLACSFSIAMAVNLILDADRPFLGFIRTPKATIERVLDLMTP